MDLDMGSKFEEVPSHLRRFAEEREMPIYQLKGQRFFGPRWEYTVTNWRVPRGSEIHVRMIPRHVSEKELVPFLEQAGSLFQLRLMMKYNGLNRGYCFAQYFTPEEADRAVYLLPKLPFLNKRFLVVTKSAENCKLILRGVPQYKTPRVIFEEISGFSRGVVGVVTDWLPVEAVPSATGNVVVEYTTHRAAAMARSSMLGRKVSFCGYMFQVEWTPLPDEKSHYSHPSASLQDVGHTQIHNASD